MDFQKDWNNNVTMRINISKLEILPSKKIFEPKLLYMS